jgi:hypothetical protein
VEAQGLPPSPLERALLDLARKSISTPRLLGPRDLEPLRAVVGDAAIDYTLVLGGFHFINRIADLLHVDPEALPDSLRRFEMFRRFGVGIAARMFSRIDLANRRYAESFEEMVAVWPRGATPAVSGSASLASCLEPIRARPKAGEILRLALEERDSRSSLDRDLLQRVHRGVEAALPSRPDEAEGFHSRPADPIDALVFVGTRYAARTTEGMIAALRRSGFDDVGILDLAIAVADANQWARTYRLLGLEAGLFSLADVWDA